MAARIFPAVPQAGERKERIIVQAEAERLLGLLGSLPLVKPVSRNQTAAANGFETAASNAENTSATMAP